MRITLDIPDTTICAFFDFIRLECDGMEMQCSQICTNDLKDGNVIVIKKAKVKDGE